MIPFQKFSGCSICLGIFVKSTESIFDLPTPFRALDKYAEANTAATEFLERNHGIGGY